jgi:peptide/nickel transport system permease protein
VLKNEEYVHAAKALGRTSIATLFRHILPNSFQVIAAQTMLQASFSILTISALSFFGLGVQPPEPSLGVMLKDGINFTDYAPWLAIFPGAAIFYVSLGLNMAGEGLIKATNPK